MHSKVQDEITDQTQGIAEERHTRRPESRHCKEKKIQTKLKALRKQVFLSSTSLFDSSQCSFVSELCLC